MDEKSSDGHGDGSRPGTRQQGISIPLHSIRISCVVRKVNLAWPTCRTELASAGESPDAGGRLTTAKATANNATSNRKDLGCSIVLRPDGRCACRDRPDNDVDLEKSAEGQRDLTLSIDLNQTYPKFIHALMRHGSRKRSVDRSCAARRFGVARQELVTHSMAHGHCCLRLYRCYGMEASSSSISLATRSLLKLQRRLSKEKAQPRKRITYLSTMVRRAARPFARPSSGWLNT
jgi:predicted O-linked N-acetylglucosamine transferase (SPINDLY family)